jgi:lipid-binding SYLF domain-containing protein
MATTHNWNRRGLAGPLLTICLMAVMGLAALWLARPVSANNVQTPTATADAREEIRDATAALQRVTAVKPIPQALLDKALGVAVFGNLVKAAFIVGGTGGDGVFVRKTATGWGAPAFVNLAGASIGAQIGGSKTDAVLVFMDQASLDALAAGRFEFGTAITAVAGPASATAETLSKSTINQVYVYAVQEGLFAGASANGTTLRFDNEENREVYGAAVTPQDFMVVGKLEVPKGLEGFAAAIKGRKTTASN